jgi:hypothetical protein
MMMQTGIAGRIRVLSGPPDVESIIGDESWDLCQNSMVLREGCIGRLIRVLRSAFAVVENSLM